MALKKLKISGLTATYTEDLDGSGGTVETLPVLINNTYNKVSIAIHPNESGTGKVQYSLSPYEKLEDGSANWFDWTHNDTTESAVDIINGPVTAVRGVCSAGQVTFEVAT